MFLKMFLHLWELNINIGQITVIMYEPILEFPSRVCVRHERVGISRRIKVRGEVRACGQLSVCRSRDNGDIGIAFTRLLGNYWLGNEV